LVEGHYPIAIDAATGPRLALQIFGTDRPTADGTFERDFIHVSDLAAAHVVEASNPSLTLNPRSSKADLTGMADN
jgi:UDP-glucose 4-epimerase